MSAKPERKKLSEAARESGDSYSARKPGRVVQHTAAQLPADYGRVLEDIKRCIRTAQVKASLSVNRELIALYWEISRLIVEQQKKEGWGKAVVEHLGEDLKREFPGVGGFSGSNLWRMRAFYLAYTEDVANLAQAAREPDRQNLQQPVGDSSVTNVPQVAAELPWFHNVALVEKLKDPIQRIWYARQTIEHGWSRAVLVHQIESNLYLRQGKALTNFQRTLPAPQSDLARQLIKDPYNFDFLGMGTDFSERQLEQALVLRLRNFLVELGKGFAFVGQQYHLEIGGEDYYLDLLFYHLRLRCYIVTDLKVGSFMPEFAGKINFYLSGVDDLLRHPDDQPSIGLILCKERNRIVVEYALRDTRKPMGVATYRVLPARLKGELPTAKQIEESLKIEESVKRTVPKKR